MKNIFLAAAVFICSFSSNATEPMFNIDKDEFTVKFGGWSYHGDGLTKDMIKKYEDESFKYNENHAGLGFEYAAPYKDTNHFIIGGAWYMKDSLNKDAFHLGLGYKYRFDMGYKLLDSIDVNLVLTYFNRGVTHAHSNFYYVTGVNADGTPGEKELHIEKSIKVVRDNFVLPAPYLTFNITDNFNIDTMLLLTPSSYSDVDENDKIIHYDEMESVFFIRAGFTF